MSDTTATSTPTLVDFHEFGETAWTVAVRRSRANRFRRVRDVKISWSQASDLAQFVATVHPELQVWIVTTAEAERVGYTCEEDAGNVLVDSGRRVPLIDAINLTDLIA